MTTTLPLTRRQEEILSYITDFAKINGVTPTNREIGAAFNFASENGVVCHLKALAKKGCIELGERYKSRKILIPGKPSDERKITLQFPMKKRHVRFVRVVHELTMQANQAPSHRELTARLGFKSPNSITRLVSECAALGLVAYRPNRSRTLRLTDKCFAQNN